MYVGVKEKLKPETFESIIAPTAESHPQYDYTIGPLKTIDDAKRYVSAMGQGVACGEG